MRLLAAVTQRIGSLSSQLDHGSIATQISELASSSGVYVANWVLTSHVLPVMGSGNAVGGFSVSCINLRQ